MQIFILLVMFFSFGLVGCSQGLEASKQSNDNTSILEELKGLNDVSGSTLKATKMRRSFIENFRNRKRPTNDDSTTGDGGSIIDDVIDDSGTDDGTGGGGGVISDPDPGQQVVQNRVVFDGRVDRTYIVHLPGNFATRATEAQVVIGFHPASSSGAGFERIAKLHEHVDARNSVVVYPDGIMKQNGNRAWNAGVCCSSGNDVGFFDAILNDLASITKIKAKVAITGYSSGAMMVYRLLCDRANQISAAAPFGAYLPESEITSPMVCPWNEVVPVAHIHGALDAQMDPNGQDNSYYQGSGIQSLPLDIYMDRVAQRNGGLTSVDQFFSVELDSDIIELNNNTAYAIIDGLGHAWPGISANGQYGPGRTDLDGTKYVMDFLLAQ